MMTKLTMVMPVDDNEGFDDNDTDEDADEDEEILMMIV
jgi:hypothetical protein